MRLMLPSPAYSIWPEALREEVVSVRPSTMSRAPAATDTEDAVRTSEELPVTTSVPSSTLSPAMLEEASETVFVPVPLFAKPMLPPASGGRETWPEKFPSPMRRAAAAREELVTMPPAMVLMPFTATECPLRSRRGAGSPRFTHFILMTPVCGPAGRQLSARQMTWMALERTRSPVLFHTVLEALR